MEQFTDCDHDWQLYTADKSYYHFCKFCKSTLYQGLIYELGEGKKPYEPSGS